MISEFKACRDITNNSSVFEIEVEIPAKQNISRIPKLRLSHPAKQNISRIFKLRLRPSEAKYFERF